MPKLHYKRISEIQKEKNSHILNYAELLSTLEWKEFRDKIVKRDNYQCKKCGEERNTYAWELKNSAPFNQYVRIANRFEKQHLGIDIVYSTKEIIINAHHKHYIKGKYPWEYDQNDLITVCVDCHNEIHKNENIMIYDNENFDNPKVSLNCSRCYGTGYLEEFKYNKNGICFNCQGSGHQTN